MSNTTPTTLDQLWKEYDHKSQECVKYKKANNIPDGLESADATYLQLLIDRDTVYLKFKELEVGEPRFSRLHKPVIEYKLNRYRDLLTHLQGGLV